MLTSVDRDDMPDGGAEHFARTVRTLKVNVQHACLVLVMLVMRVCVCVCRWVGNWGLLLHPMNNCTFVKLPVTAPLPGAALLTQTKRQLTVALPCIKSHANPLTPLPHHVLPLALL